MKIEARGRGRGQYQVRSLSLSLSITPHTIIIKQLIFVFIIDSFSTVGRIESRQNEDRIFAGKVFKSIWWEDLASERLVLGESG